MAILSIFYASAGLAVISAAHHVHRGHNELYPSWKARLPSHHYRTAYTGWSYMNVSYAVTSKLVQIYDIISYIVFGMYEN